MYLLYDRDCPTYGLLIINSDTPEFATSSALTCARDQRVCLQKRICAVHYRVYGHELTWCELGVTLLAPKKGLPYFEQRSQPVSWMDATSAIDHEQGWS